MDLVRTNRVLAAEEAARWGLVSRVVEDDNLDDAAFASASAPAARSGDALRGAERLLHARSRDRPA